MVPSPVGRLAGRAACGPRRSRARSSQARSSQARSSRARSSQARSSRAGICQNPFHLWRPPPPCRALFMCIAAIVSAVFYLFYFLLTFVLFVSCWGHRPHPPVSLFDLFTLSLPVVYMPLLARCCLNPRCLVCCIRLFPSKAYSLTSLCKLHEWITSKRGTPCLLRVRTGGRA